MAKIDAGQSWPGSLENRRVLSACSVTAFLTLGAEAEAGDLFLLWQGYVRRVDGDLPHGG